MIIKYSTTPMDDDQYMDDEDYGEECEESEEEDENEEKEQVQFKANLDQLFRSVYESNSKY